MIPHFAMHKPKPYVSVIIPAYNEQDNIGRCLASLAQQEFPRSYEVIVVDNGSTDDTASVAERYADRLDLRVIRELRKGRGRARRSGHAIARGHVLLSTDADAVLPPNWISAFCDALAQNPEAVFAAGTTRIDDCPPLVNATYNAYRPMWTIITRLWNGWYQFGTASFAVRRWAYFASGGFSADLDAHDDIDIGRRLKFLGSSKVVFGAPVMVSGRRYRNGMTMAMAEYLFAYFERFWLKKKWVALTDVR